MPYMSSLLRYFVVFFYCSWDNEEYLGEIFKVSSIGVCLIGRLFVGSIYVYFVLFL